MPEPGVLYSERFDNVVTNRGNHSQVKELQTDRLFLQNVSLAESWSGYALEISGNKRSYCLIPAVSPPRKNFSVSEGSLRLWVSPAWHKDGPSKSVTILEAAEGSTSPRVGFMLYFDPVGSLVRLGVFGGGETADLLSCPVQWQPGQWHQVGLTYSAQKNATELFIDGQSVAKGLGMGPMEQLVAIENWVLYLGGDHAGNAGELVVEEFTAFNGVCLSDQFDWNYQSLMGYIAPRPFLLHGHLQELLNQDSGQLLMQAQALPPSPGGGGGSSNSLVSGYTIPTNGLRLTIPLFAITTNYTNIHLTLLDAETNAIYALYFTTNLATGTNWVKVVQGAVGQSNFTHTNALASFGAYRIASLDDTDGDGMPDKWELLHGLNPAVNDANGDADGDGLSNLQEYLLGSDPQDASSVGATMFARFRFDRGDLIGDGGQVPLRTNGMQLVSGVSSNAAHFAVGTNGLGTLINYRESETNGNANIRCDLGTIRFWFRPDWSSLNAGGNGPLHESTFVELGSYSSNASVGLWSWRLDSAGTNLFLLTHSAGQTSKPIQAPVCFHSNYWYLISLTYCATSSAVYTNASLAQSGAGVSYFPSMAVRNNGIFIGADSNRLHSLTGSLDNFETYSYVWTSDQVGLWDEDGDGLPDWYEVLVSLTDPLNPDTGNTGVIDSYRDPDSDGWTNLEELQRGTNPTNWDTPAAPQVWVRIADSTGTNLIVEWNPAKGPVQGYYITNQWLGEIMEISAGQTSAIVHSDPNYPVFGEGWIIPSCMDMIFVASYANGRVGTAAVASLQRPELILDGAYVVHGSSNHWYLAVPPLPSNVDHVRVFTDFFDTLSGAWFFPGFDLYPSNFVNGLWEFPAATIAEFAGESFHVQTKLTDGGVGQLWPAGMIRLGETVGGQNYPQAWVNASAQLKDNLKFLLRAASVQHPLSYSVGPQYTDYSPLVPFTFYLSEGSANYARSDIWGSPFWEYPCPYPAMPIFYNYLWHNLGFSASAISDIRPTSWDGGRVIGYSGTPDYLYNGNPYASGGTSALNIASLDVIYERSIAPDADEPWGDLGCVFTSNSQTTNVHLNANACNAYGLPITAVHLQPSDENSIVVSRGGTQEVPPGSFDAFFQVQMPTLETVGYYFADLDCDPPRNCYYAPKWPMPGSADFSVTNTSPIIFGSVGVPMQIAGWAKQRIVNGNDPTKFAYLGQYFDKAYKVGSNGLATTNQSGILSEYGEFFPTEPGLTALLTKSDGGIQGTTLVNVLKLQLDVNHDADMDLSFGGPDNTSAARPFMFWLNNDRDDVASGTNLDHDVYLQPTKVTDNCDYSFGQIRSKRNFEDFARLWICGIPTLPASEGYSVQIGWSQIESGAPKLRLYRATESNGGIGYLTNTSAASQQINDYNYPIGEVTTTNSLTMPSSWFTNGLNRFFLFEAGAAGKGALTLTISKGLRVVSQTSSWIEFHDIRDFYEEVAITNVIQTWPAMVQTNLNSHYSIISYPSASIGNALQTAVFVHGWRMPYSDYTIFSQTMLKRLYWQGYQGKFATVRWPTRSSDTDSSGLDLTTYNRSEYISFQSATGMALYLYDLRNRFTNDVISVCSHSQGGILMMEALKELSDANVSPLDNYVLMEAAVPAHCYDNSIKSLPGLVSKETNIPTPNTYANYAVGMRSALRGGNICNLFNPADFALVSGLSGTGFGSWESNEELLKPLVFFGYIYLATNQTAYVITNQFTAAFGFTNLQNRIVTDPLELMPFVARPRSKAVGAQAGVGNVVNGQEYNLQSQLGFTAASYDHSGQFNRNIQTVQVQGFYSRLLKNLFPPAP